MQVSQGVGESDDMADQKVDKRALGEGTKFNDYAEKARFFSSDVCGLGRIGYEEV